jgi:hypothetical protein
MMGVAVQESERAMAAEFFELFKTPWEFFRNGGEYDVVISTGEPMLPSGTRLALVFGAAPVKFDNAKGLEGREVSEGCTFSYGERTIPVYGAAAVFPGCEKGILKEVVTKAAGAIAFDVDGVIVVRLGYNLFEETRFLLGRGQPIENAAIASLEEHIAFLRDMIVAAGLPLVEIPPVPGEHNFIVCLTHDIDHPVLRNHRFDHTMFGFLYRATLGGLLDLFRGRKGLKSLFRNASAAVQLPFVHLGMAQDFWNNFDRYLELEAGQGTYFVIPRRDYPGRKTEGYAPAMRASSYDLAEIAPQLRRIASAGGELGVHGIDAWLDGDAGKAERKTVAEAFGLSELGIRMHWLYFDEKSPAVLEQAGFSYDSTFGYNETIGYRAGTTQAFKPAGAKNLLELPLHVMDTALFYPKYLGLDEAGARGRINPMLENLERFGGALTINWHDRSIAPERLWEEFYLESLAELKRRKAWFATGSQAVAWFRKRRSTVLETKKDAGQLMVRARVEQKDALPGLRIRVHQPKDFGKFEPHPGLASSGFVDTPLNDVLEMSIAV